MLSAPGSSIGKNWECFSEGQRRSLRLSALLHVAHVQPICKAASAIALLRQHDPEHAREEHARHKRCRLATHGWFSFQTWRTSQAFSQRLSLAQQGRGRADEVIE